MAHRKRQQYRLKIVKGSLNGNHKICAFDQTPQPREVSATAIYKQTYKTTLGDNYSTRTMNLRTRVHREMVGKGNG